ncbi:MAG: IPExxxVDY family protein [Bacteroidetes bacterium]|nr:MAG: IPExxxVDY family protein [Bacteroidota bacterium]
MKKKISGNIDYFEDYHLLAIVSPLKDYTLTHFINKQLRLQLKKYDDLRTSEEGKPYSWYYYRQGNKYMSCFLIGNNHPKHKLIPALKNYDYFFLIRNANGDEMLQSMTSGIRGIQNVVGVFKQNMSVINGMDVLIESNELHEMEQIISSVKKVKNKK